MPTEKPYNKDHRISVNSKRACLSKLIVGVLVNPCDNTGKRKTIIGGDSFSMYPQPKRIKIEPGSELARLLEEANKTPLLLEKDGILYHLTASDQEEDIWADYDPEQVK